jgi:hypothetical protein
MAGVRTQGKSMMKHEGESSADKTRSYLALLLGSLWLAGCGAPTLIGPEPNEPGIQPEEAGADGHLAAAAREEARLVQHEKLYDPNARQSVSRCDPEHAQQHPGAPVCWVEAINPTAIHLAEMEVHRTRAVYHKKAARDLRAAQDVACAGVAAASRNSNALERRGDVLGVGPLEEQAVDPRGKPRLVGATILLRRTPGVTAGELQRSLNCQVARSATVGYGLNTTEAERSPLSERGAQVTVHEWSSGFAVNIRADDPFAAQAILIRAQRLAVVK